MIFLHEYVLGGGLGLADQPLPMSWVREGRAMRQALIDGFYRPDETLVVTTLGERFDPEPDEPGVQRIRVGPGREESIVREQSARADWSLIVAPESGGLLEERARWIVESGGRSLGSSPAAIALTSDKLRLADHFRSRGIPHPATFALPPDGSIPVGLTFPAILKPLDGAGTLETFRIHRPGDWPVRTDWTSPMIAQEWVEGESRSFCGIVRPGGDPVIPLGLGRQTIEAGPDGELAYRGGTIPAPGPGLAEGLRAIRSVPGLAGFVGVDFVLKADGGVVVIEINSRPTTSLVGLTWILGAGTIADAWLGAFDEHRATEGLLDEVLSHPPVGFLADGTILD